MITMENLNLEPYLAQGWKLSEFLNWISEEEKSNFLKIVGQDNIFILDEKSFSNRWKAKLLISPEGIQILNLFFMPCAGSA